MKRVIVCGLAIGFLVGAGGCRHKCCRSGCDSGPTLGPPVGTIPPPGVPTVPSTMPSANPPPPSPSSLTPSNFRPAPDLLLPDPLPAGSGSSRSLSSAADSQKPVVGAVPWLGVPTKPGTPTTEPPVAKSQAPATLPNLTGLTNFARVSEGVATGRKPTLEGFDSLKQAGYRTIVLLHGAGADVSAAKDVAEKKGLTLIAIDATPEKIGEALGQLTRQVQDMAARPLYVCDETGVRTGALWYLYFRTAETLGDDVARVRARAYGLTEEGDEAKAFWVAAQQYLATR